MKLSSTRWEPQSLAFWAALCKVYAHHHHGQAVPNMRWAWALGRERDRLRGSTVRTGSAHWGLPGAQAEPTPWQGLPAQREMQGAPSCLDLTSTRREASSKCVVPVHSQEQGNPGNVREAEQDDSLSLHSSHALVMLLVAVWTAQAVMLHFFTIPAVQHMMISAQLPQLQSRCMAPHHGGCRGAGWALTGGPLVHKVSPTLRSSLRPFNSVFLELLVSHQQSLMQTEGCCKSQAGVPAKAEPGAGLLFFG